MSGRIAMTTQILRTIDRWRFEIPLSLALGAAAGFAALSAPAELMARVPVAGDMGMAGRAIIAVLLAVVAAGAGYLAMRRPSRPEPKAADPIDEIPEDERPSSMPEGRFARFRRADAHPDAPPREPIIASRDLGEPFMDVGGFAPPPSEAEPQTDEAWWPESTIPDADYVEVPETDVPPAPEAAEPAAVEAPVPEAAAVEAVPAAAPVREATVPPRVDSISAMMERLSAGLERRATVPPRDPGPALRNALAELNRLAERRD